MEILVTGGAGFIGANFIRYVLESTDDVRVTNLDLLTYAGNPANLADLEDDPRYAFVRADIRDAEAVSAAMRGHDAVVNFAAETHVDRSIDGPTAFLSTNVTGAGVVFEAARRHEVERCLHISTDEVYGSIEEGASREGDPLLPNSPYAAAKAGADLLVRAYRETYGYPITVTRTGNNFGPFHFPEKMIPLFVTNLIDGQKVPLYGDGLHVRDWTYVRNNVAAQWQVLTRGTPGEVYNVADGNQIRNVDLTRRLLDLLGHDDEMIEHVTDRPGHDRRYALDTSKVRSELGWAPEVDLDAALERTVAWYREHETWWRPLKERGATARRGVVT